MEEHIDDKIQECEHIQLEAGYVTHPLSYDFEHKKKFDCFANDLQRALHGAFPSRARQYDGVEVLLIDWKDDDLGCASEIKDLDAQFKRQFNFTTKRFSVPSVNSERALQDRLFDLDRANRQGSRLLIVYYGGHGEWNDYGNSIWRANRHQDSPMLNWYSLQPILERSPCDVALIFDCCYAASAARSAPDGTTEILAACGREFKTPGVSDHSFTRVLMQEMSSFGSSPFTIAQLHTRLIKDRQKLQRTPIHAFLSDASCPSILLSSLLLSNDTSSILNTVSEILDDVPESSDALATNGDASPNEDSNDSTQPTSPSYSQPFREPRVLLAVSIESNAQPPDVTSWARWLASEAPPGIQNIDVRIESAYISNSTLMLLSLPIALWSRLPETSAYRFVDFIRSSNLLREELPRAPEDQAGSPTKDEKSRTEVQHQSKQQGLDELDFYYVKRLALSLYRQYSEAERIFRDVADYAISLHEVFIEIEGKHATLPATKIMQLVISKNDCERALEEIETLLSTRIARTNKLHRRSQSLPQIPSELTELKLELISNTVILLGYIDVKPKAQDIQKDTRSRFKEISLTDARVPVDTGDLKPPQVNRRPESPKSEIDEDYIFLDETVSIRGTIISTASPSSKDTISFIAPNSSRDTIISTAPTSTNVTPSASPLGQYQKPSLNRPGPEKPRFISKLRLKSKRTS